MVSVDTTQGGQCDVVGYEVVASDQMGTRPAMRFSDAKGHKVVDKSTASAVGQVRGFLVDPESRSVAALGLKKTDRGNVLRWSDVDAFGIDAVTIGDSAAITSLTVSWRHFAASVQEQPADECSGRDEPEPRVASA